MCSIMRPASEFAQCLELRARGLNASEISRRTGVPRPTVRDWLHGRAPRRRAGPGCGVCGHGVHDASHLPSSYVYLLGIYLGDGCISAHPRGVFRLRVFLDAAYPGIAEEVAGAMRAVRPANPVGRATPASGYSGQRGTCLELSSYSRSWPCLIPQHGPGRKHERRIVLTDWQRELVARSPELLLRGLIHSDGCRFVNTGRGGWSNPRYAFYNVSDDIRGIFCDACDLLGLHWTTAPRTVYVSRKADVARMDEFIGPKA
jgi:Homeodomain-like domain-containing protein